MIPPYTPTRLRFWLKNWEALEEGYLPRYTEEDVRARSLPLALKKRGYSGWAPGEALAIIRADLFLAGGRLPKPLRDAVYEGYIRYGHYRDEIGRREGYNQELNRKVIRAVAGKLRISTRELRQRMYEGTQRMSEILELEGLYPREP